MTTFSLRRIATVGVASVAALALAACTPPNENPSDIKVDTATEYDGPHEAETRPASGTDEDTTTANGTDEDADAEAEDTDVAAAELPGFIDCVGTPAEEPEVITLDCVTYADQITNIEWEEWGEDEAVGTGLRLSTLGQEDDVEVVLSSLTTTPQGLVFSQIAVDGEIVTP